MIEEELTMKIYCPNCSQKLELMQNAAGQIINCPTCESDIIIPDFESEASSDLLDVYSMPEKIRNGVFIIPISLIVSLVIGITYSLLNFYIPIFGITTILFMGGFVVLNVYLIYICAKYTKCTSRHYLLFCGLLACQSSNKQASNVTHDEYNPNSPANKPQNNK
jgi:DNA-directed RNA polymerase subunit RPC12/RpoP